jgi:hypothetical protein
MATVAATDLKAASRRDGHIDKMPGHWLLAKMGKRVLRPGGLHLTHKLLDQLDICPTDRVVEFAPGLGVTARLTLLRAPDSYCGVERDTEAAASLQEDLSAMNYQCINRSAEDTGLPSACATVVYGEAMLSMQPATTKARIVAEASRLLQPGGRFGIHELCLVPNDVSDELRQSIQQALSNEIHVGVRPLSCKEWRQLLEAAGLEIVGISIAPMHLLEPKRIVQDEGLWAAARFAWNVATHRSARQRVLRMRRVFCKYRDHLAAIAIVARKIST